MASAPVVTLRRCSEALWNKPKAENQNKKNKKKKKERKRREEG